MATFKLTPCKLRDGWLVPKKGEQPLEMDWKQLREALAPTRSLLALRNLRIGMQPNAYVGLLKQPNGLTTNFVVRNTDLSGDLRRMVRQDPLLAQRLIAAYRVESVQWDDKVIEPATTKPSTL
jgi:hypothetical protein